MNRNSFRKPILFEYKHNPTFRSNYIDVAIAAGYITQSHPENPTHPDQYYYLTEKGLKFRKQLIKE